MHDTKENLATLRGAQKVFLRPLQIAQSLRRTAILDIAVEMTAGRL